MQVKNFKLNFLYYWGPPAVQIYDLPITTLFIYLFILHAAWISSAPLYCDTQIVFFFITTCCCRLIFSREGIC